MKQNISKLVQMCDKEWMYNTRNYKFVEVDGEEFPLTLITDKREFKFEVDAEVKFFMEACLPVDGKVNEMAVAVPGANDLFAKLGDILLDNIDKVRENPEYIKQASVISKQVQTMINLTNLQMNIRKGK